MADATLSNKRKIAADDEEGACLPSVVVFRLVSFCDFPTRMALCLTCKKVRDDLEEYEKKIYEKIKQEHDNDDTFDARVRDQSTLNISKAAGKRPVGLPHRYLKTAAMKKPLQQITFRFGYGNHIVVSPSGNFVSIVDPENGEFHVIDLAARGQIVSLAHWDDGLFQGLAKTLMFDDTRIFSCSFFSAVREWNQTLATGHWTARELPECPYEDFEWIVYGDQVISFAVDDTHDEDVDGRLSIFSCV